MRKTILFSLCFLMVLAGVSSAATYRYHDAKGTPANNGDWNNVTNWFSGGAAVTVLPGEFDVVELPESKFGVPAAEELTFVLSGTAEATVNHIAITSYAVNSPTFPVTLTMNGQLRVKVQNNSQWYDGMLTLGNPSTGKGTLIMNGGRLDVDDTIWIGSGSAAEGEIVINDGEVYVGYNPSGTDGWGDFVVGRDGGTGHLEMAGGTLYTDNFTVGTLGTVNFPTGSKAKIVVNNTWQEPDIQGYITSGQITGAVAAINTVDGTTEITAAPCTEELLGDISGDCKVNTEDLILMVGNWLVGVDGAGQPSVPYPPVAAGPLTTWEATMSTDPVAASDWVLRNTTSNGYTISGGVMTVGAGTTIIDNAPARHYNYPVEAWATLKATEIAPAGYQTLSVWFAVDTNMTVAGVVRFTVEKVSATEQNVAVYSNADNNNALLRLTGFGLGMIQVHCVVTPNGTGGTIAIDATDGLTSYTTQTVNYTNTSPPGPGTGNDAGLGVISIASFDVDGQVDYVKIQSTSPAL